MTPTEIQFTARVARHGYQWRGAVLTDALPDGWTLAEGLPVVTEDLRDRAVFRAFAALPFSKEAIKAFADQFGLLGVEKIRPRGGDGVSALAVGESFARWRMEIAGLRAAIDLAQ